VLDTLQMMGAEDVRVGKMAHLGDDSARCEGEGTAVGDGSCDATAAVGGAEWVRAWERREREEIRKLARPWEMLRKRAWKAHWDGVWVW
jgi:hypothetical protein